MAIIIVILTNVLSIQAQCTTDIEIKLIELTGEWLPKGKSIILSCPITVSVDDSFLYIQNEFPDRDIVISIINEFTGETEYEKTIEKSQTAYVAVSVLNLTAGEYKIEITGSPIGFLEGKFIKH